MEDREGREGIGGSGLRFWVVADVVALEGWLPEPVNPPRQNQKKKSEYSNRHLLLTDRLVTESISESKVVGPSIWRWVDGLTVGSVSKNNTGMLYAADLRWLTSVLL